MQINFEVNYHISQEKVIFQMIANQSYLVKIVLIMHNKCSHTDIEHNSVNSSHAEQRTRWLTKQSIGLITRYHKIILSGLEHSSHICLFVFIN